MLPIIATGLIYAAIAYFMEQAMTKGDTEFIFSTGAFLAFNAAFGTFFAAALELSQTAFSVLEVIPMWQRAKPILETLPEVNVIKTDPGVLSGEIEARKVLFRYEAGAQPVLHEVTFKAAPGEFVAIVGPSGSGKSTLLRLLLGFETPEAGSVFYDCKDLHSLDARAVRRQIGVVLQSGKLQAADIFTNIVGAAPLPLEAAWAAARMAGFDQDVKEMPMGMQTVISEDASTISGGQRQRLLIARALVRKPRIIYFDEATSALDNRTQAIVSRSLETLDATRVVIAHRLTTIRNADRIYVMERGRVVQCGSYDELMQETGALFARLAARQIVEEDGEDPFAP
jgi:ABC-type bacteriocin/lantibiotic exporter with double-glycine peptidase domain